VSLIPWMLHYCPQKYCHTMGNNVGREVGVKYTHVLVRPQIPDRHLGFTPRRTKRRGSTALQGTRSIGVQGNHKLVHVLEKTGGGESARDQGFFQQFCADRTSDRKPVEGCGFRIFQCPPAPSLARNLAKRRVVVRCPMDGGRASRTTLRFYELIFFFSLSLLALLACSFRHSLSRCVPPFLKLHQSIDLALNSLNSHALFRISSFFLLSFMHSVIRPYIFISSVIGSIGLSLMG